MKYSAEKAAEARQQRLALAKAQPPYEPPHGPSKYMGLDRYELLLKFGEEHGKKPHEIDKMLAAAGCIMNNDRPGPLLSSKGGYCVYYDQYVRAVLTGDPLPAMIDETAEIISKPSAEPIDFDAVVAAAPTSVVTPGELVFDQEEFEAWYMEQDDEIQKTLPVTFETVMVMRVDWGEIANLVEQGLEIGGVKLIPLKILEGAELEKALNTCGDADAGDTGDGGGDVQAESGGGTNQS